MIEILGILIGISGLFGGWYAQHKSGCEFDKQRKALDDIKKETKEIIGKYKTLGYNLSMTEKQELLNEINNIKTAMPEKTIELIQQDMDILGNKITISMNKISDIYQNIPSEEKEEIIAIEKGNRDKPQDKISYLDLLDFEGMNIQQIGRNEEIESFHYDYIGQYNDKKFIVEIREDEIEDFTLNGIYARLLNLKIDNVFIVTSNSANINEGKINNLINPYAESHDFNVFIIDINRDPIESFSSCLQKLK